MALILSCGHEVKNTYDEYTIITKDSTAKGKRAIAYRSVCTKCKLGYIADDTIFINEDEAINWMFEE